MASIVYLDAEDEITSAAARIRQAADRRVALVVPFGSRVATSRINFKLLAREATANGRRLDIVAPDASARALAASAGLAVFASVNEYEEALESPAPDAGPAAEPATIPAGAASPGAPRAARPERPAGGGMPAAGRGGDDAAELAAREAELDAIVHRSREAPLARSVRWRPGGGLVLGVLVLLAGIAVAVVAAVLFLPAAEISIRPHLQRVGPVELVVTADPGATAVDETARRIPAVTVDVPVTVTGEFPVTGKRVEQTPAQGEVRWRNCDPSASYTIPAGTVVRAAGGIEFSIDESVFLPVAIISGAGANVSLRCQSSEVAVTAVKPGPDGNVEAGAIAVVPARYNRTLITVTNLQPITGGSREEFPRVAPRDVDAALEMLGVDLQAQFQIEVEAPAGVPAGMSVYPETATLGLPAPTVDPESLVGQEVELFTLGLTATGTVLAVDPGPAEVIARAALAEAVSPGHELVEGSGRVVIGEGTVDGDLVVFRVAAAAKEIRPVDGHALRRQVMGLSAADARALLEPYGDVEIVLWPDMVGSIPTVDQRVTLVVLDAVDDLPDEAPDLPSPGAGARPAGDGNGALASQPVPSG